MNENVVEFTRSLLNYFDIMVKLKSFLDYVQRHEGVRWRGVIGPSILKVWTNRSWLVPFAFLFLYPKGKGPGYPSDRRGIVEICSKVCVEETNLYPCRKSNPDPPVVHSVD
jgi:hypothetical protein